MEGKVAFVILVVVPVMIQRWRGVKRMHFPQEETQQVEKLLSRN